MRSLTYYVTIITETRRLILIGRKFKKERKTGGVLKRAMKKKFLAGCSFAVAAAVVLGGGFGYIKPVAAESGKNINSAYNQALNVAATSDSSNNEIITVGDELGLCVDVLSAKDFSSFKLGRIAIKREELQKNRKVLTGEGIASDISGEFVGPDKQAFYARCGFTYEETPSQLVYARERINAANELYRSAGAYNVYFSRYREVKTYKVSFVGYKDKEFYSSAFSESFLEDLKKLENGELTAEEIFSFYGTHVVGSAIYGGRKNFARYIASDDPAFNGALSEFKRLFRSAGATGISTEAVFNAFYKGVPEAEKFPQIKNGYASQGVGGKSYPNFSQDGCLPEYISLENEWAATLKADTKMQIIVDYGDGLVPLWSILPDEYAVSAAMLEATFGKLFKEECSAVYSACKADPATDDGTGDLEDLPDASGENSKRDKNNNSDGKQTFAVRFESNFVNYGKEFGVETASAFIRPFLTVKAFLYAFFGSL